MLRDLRYECYLRSESGIHVIDATILHICFKTEKNQIIYGPTVLFGSRMGIVGTEQTVRAASPSTDSTKKFQNKSDQPVHKDAHSWAGTEGWLTH